MKFMVVDEAGARLKPQIRGATAALGFPPRHSRSMTCTLVTA